MRFVHVSQPPQWLSDWIGSTVSNLISVGDPAESQMFWFPLVHLAYRYEIIIPVYEGIQTDTFNVECENAQSGGLRKGDWMAMHHGGRVW